MEVLFCLVAIATIAALLIPNKKKKCSHCNTELWIDPYHGVYWCPTCSEGGDIHDRDDGTKET